MNPALAALVARRCAPKAFVLGALGLAVAAILAQRTAAGSVQSALARESVWTMLIVGLAPFSLHRAAALVGRWRAGEIEWLGKAPIRRVAVVSSAWIGALAAALALLAGIALAAEFAARGGGTSERRLSSTPAPDEAVLDGTAPVRWTTNEVPRAASVARLYLAYVPIQVAADVELVARVPSSGEERVARARVASRKTLDVDLPPHEGLAIELELRRVGEGGIVLLDRERVDWLVRSADARWASVSLAAHAALAACAWLAIALGFGAWMQGSIATAATLALALLGWLAENELVQGAWPGADLLEALDLAGRNVVPDLPSSPVCAASAACVLIGLALAWLGTRVWRAPS